MKAYEDIDDEIQILYEKSPEPMFCELCSEDLTTWSVQRKQVHYDMHLPDESRGKSSKPISSSKPSSSSKPVSKSSSGKTKQQGLHPEENVFWYSSQVRPPPRNFSPGLIPVLKKALIKLHGMNRIERAWLCHERAVHIGAEGFDRRWGCGYRNFLMACAVLMVQSQQPMYFPLLDSPTPPGIRNLQAWIEEAWEEGYDKDGADELDHCLVNTRKWIGTAELHVAFTSRGIPSQLVDFEFKEGGVDVLIDWVFKYFSAGDGHPKDATVDQALRAARPVLVTEKMPLILQHAGHSRTIIGVERVKGGQVNFLVFDPSKAPLAALRTPGLAAHGLVDRGEPSSKHSFPGANLVHQVANAMKTYQTHKRKANISSADSSNKRVRAATDENHSRDDPIMIDSDDEEGFVQVKRAEDDPNCATVVSFFRVTPAQLRKNKKYQILYFPLDLPWDEFDRRQRREVLSIKIR